MDNKRVRCIVRGIVREAPGVSTLKLTLKDGSVPAFVPGQFVNVYFPEANTPEGKAYSVSSSPEEETFSITVRAIGEFSNRLCGMNMGDSFEASLPYGFFRPEREESPVVMVAAGIGITPFRSMLLDAARRAPARKIALLHSVRTVKDAVFRTEFETLKSTLPNFSLSYFVTREAVPETADFIPRRITGSDALLCTPDAKEDGVEFLLCGSIAFTRDMWRSLTGAGASEDSIYTEAFFSH